MNNIYDKTEEIKVETVPDEEGFFRDDGNLDGIPDSEQTNYNGPVIPPINLIPPKNPIKPRKKFSKLKLATLICIPIYIYLMFFPDIGSDKIVDVEFPKMSQTEILSEAPELEMTQSDILWLKSISQMPEVQDAIKAVESGEEESMTHYISYTELPVENRPEHDYSNVLYMAYKNSDGTTSWVVSAEYTIDGEKGSRQVWDMNIDEDGDVHKNMTLYDKWGRTDTYYSNDGYSLYKHTYKYQKGLIHLIFDRSGND